MSVGTNRAPCSAITLMAHAGTLKRRRRQRLFLCIEKVQTTKTAGKQRFSSKTHSARSASEEVVCTVFAQTRVDSHRNWAPACMASCQRHIAPRISSAPPCLRASVGNQHFAEQVDPGITNPPGLRRFSTSFPGRHPCAGCRVRAIPAPLERPARSTRRYGLLPG